MNNNNMLADATGIEFFYIYDKDSYLVRAMVRYFDALDIRYVITSICKIEKVVVKIGEPFKEEKVLLSGGEYYNIKDLVNTAFNSKHSPVRATMRLAVSDLLEREPWRMRIATQTI